MDVIFFLAGFQVRLSERFGRDAFGGVCELQSPLARLSVSSETPRGGRPYRRTPERTIRSWLDGARRSGTVGHSGKVLGRSLARGEDHGRHKRRNACVG